MEVIISVMILSVVMLALLQIKSQNVFMITKADEKAKINDYILLGMDFTQVQQEENSEVRLKDRLVFENEEIRKELKDLKIKIKTNDKEEYKIKTDKDDINLSIISNTYSLDEEENKKNIYEFKIEL